MEQTPPKGEFQQRRGSEGITELQEFPEGAGREEGLGHTGPKGLKEAVGLSRQLLRGGGQETHQVQAQEGMRKERESRQLLGEGEERVPDPGAGREAEDSAGTS